MRYVNIIQRFIPIQFGKTYNEEALLNRFEDCLDKINQENYKDIENAILGENYKFLFSFIRTEIFRSYISPSVEEPNVEENKESCYSVNILVPYPKQFNFIWYRYRNASLTSDDIVS